MAQDLIDGGEWKPVEQPRKPSHIAGQKNAPIVAEEHVLVWAVAHYFGGGTWAKLAEMFSSPGASTHPAAAPAARKAKRRREDQIRTNVKALLRDLGLPPHMPE